nr:hypothetical protein GCM10020093_004050 [Planobispora longispora]
MVANAFLQNPAGAADRGDHLELVDPGALLANPMLVMALPHVIGASLLTGGFVVMGASAYRLFRRTSEQRFFTASLRFGVVVAAVGAVVTVAFGFAQFGPVGEFQPGKFDDAPLAGAGLGFMIMIGELLQLFVLFFLLPVIHWLPRWRWVHPLVMLATPLPFLAAILGWLAREVGRQPWLIYGKLTVADAMSPGLTSGMVTTSLIAFTAVLGLLAVTDYILIARTVRRGPAAVSLGAAPTGPDPAPERAAALSL